MEKKIAIMVRFQNQFKINVTRYGLASIFVTVSVFGLSMLISPLYIYGDQIEYRRVYSYIQGLGFFDSFYFYSSALDSHELIHFFLSWIFSNAGIDKDLFVSFFNAVLAFFIMKLFYKWKVKIYISIFLVLSNFYFYVLFFSAERLKFRFIFMILSIIYIKRLRIFYFIATLSFFSHVQMIIIYISMFFGSMFQSVRRFLMSGRLPGALIFVSLVAVFPLLLMTEQLTSKFMVYRSDNDIFELLRIFAFFVLSVWYAKNKMEAAFVFIPLIIAVYFVGGDRINIFGYFAFLYYGLPVRGGVNFGVIATGLYFAYVGAGFIYNIVTYGVGFYFG